MAQILQMIVTLIFPLIPTHSLSYTVVKSKEYFLKGIPLAV